MLELPGLVSSPNQSQMLVGDQDRLKPSVANEGCVVPVPHNPLLSPVHGPSKF